MKKVKLAVMVFIAILMATTVYAHDLKGVS
jgi:hypothetical protein